MHLYEGHFWGMHFIWWIVWLVFIFWIFLTPWDVPGQRTKKETPLDILKKRLASGEINTHEFEERKKLLENK
ncbi:MAG: SHOCT domain-containing protein [Owenweeksia sp.]